MNRTCACGHDRIEHTGPLRLSSGQPAGECMRADCDCKAYAPAPDAEPLLTEAEREALKEETTKAAAAEAEINRQSEAVKEWIRELETAWHAFDLFERSMPRRYPFDGAISPVWKLGAAAFMAGVNVLASEIAVAGDRIGEALESCSRSLFVIERIADEGGFHNENAEHVIDSGD